MSVFVVLVQWEIAYILICAFQGNNRIFSGTIVLWREDCNVTMESWMCIVLWVFILVVGLVDDGVAVVGVQLVDPAKGDLVPCLILGYPIFDKAVNGFARLIVMS